MDRHPQSCLKGYTCRESLGEAALDQRVVHTLALAQEVPRMRTRKDAKERTDGIEGILGQDREIACTEVPDITVNIIDIRRETGREREKGRGTEIETEEGMYVLNLTHKFDVTC